MQGIFSGLRDCGNSRSDKLELVEWSHVLLSDCRDTWFALMVSVTIDGMGDVSITLSCQWIEGAIL